MVMKTLILLLAATSAGVVILRKGQRTLQHAVDADVAGRTEPTFGDRFRRLDLHTAGLAAPNDDHEDLLTPPRP